jgi:hypothetical protein
MPDEAILREKPGPRLRSGHGAGSFPLRTASAASGLGLPAPYARSR